MVAPVLAQSRGAEADRNMSAPLNASRWGGQWQAKAFAVGAVAILVQPQSPESKSLRASGENVAAAGFRRLFCARRPWGLSSSLSR